jgi:D-serine dehydratase
MDWRIKGLPHGIVDIDLSDIAAKRWNVLNEDLPLPVAVLRDSALTKNRRWMREFLERTGAKLAPHGKTHMSPQLLRWQLEDSAWAITLATVHQVRVARAAGVNRILLANELVGTRDIEYILDELRRHPSFEFLCLVDSVAGVNRLADAARRAPVGRALPLLIEVGYSEGRAGCRGPNSARAVAQAITAAAPYLELVGVEGFEGLHSSLPASEAIPRVRDFLNTIVDTAECLDKEGFFNRDEIIISAGGSAYYDLVTEVFAQSRLTRKACTVLRSGCYFTHDAGSYERLFSEALERSSLVRGIGVRFDSALEVWAYVLWPRCRGAGTREAFSSRCRRCTHLLNP